MELSNVSQPLSKGGNIFLVPALSALTIAARALLLSECPKQPRYVQKGVLLERFNFDMTWSLLTPPDGLGRWQGGFKLVRQVHNS